VRSRAFPHDEGNDPGGDEEETATDMEGQKKMGERFVHAPGLTDPAGLTIELGPGAARWGDFRLPPPFEMR